jgi:DNA-binding MarR family transcriptional regulator
LDSIPLEEIAKNLKSLSWDILSLLSRNESMSCSDIKAKLKLTQPKSTAEISRLEGALLIESSREDDDKRFLKYKLTEYGISVLKYRNKG